MSPWNSRPQIPVCLRFFSCGPFLKIFIELVTVLLLFYVFLGFQPQDMCDLSSLARNQTGTSTLEGKVLTS